MLNQRAFKEDSIPGNFTAYNVLMIPMIAMILDGLFSADYVLGSQLPLNTNAGIPCPFKEKDIYYRSNTVNSKSFVGKVFLKIRWKFEQNNTL